MNNGKFDIIFSAFNIRMANLKSDDWRENMRERMEKEKAEKEA